MDALLPAILTVGLLALLVLRSVTVVQAGMSGVVVRMGRFHAVHNPGIHLILPFVDRVRMVDMTQQRLTEQVEATTKDEVAVVVDTSFFRQVLDARLALFAVSNYALGVNLVARKVVRDTLPEMTLAELLAQRKSVSRRLETRAGDLVRDWGVRIDRFEIDDISSTDGAGATDLPS